MEERIEAVDCEEYTYEEWLQAAGMSLNDVAGDMRAAWRAGEDPGAYSKFDPDAQCPQHGCARWRCDEDHA